MDATEVLTRAAHDAAVARVEDAHERFDREMAGDDGAWDGYPLGDPFDGCVTCIVREALDAAWPLIRAAALDDARRQLDPGR